MKQHITVSQLQELSPQAKEKFEKWGKDQGWFIHFVDEPPDVVFARCIGIGQMIGFLIDNGAFESEFGEPNQTANYTNGAITIDWYDGSNEKIELADALWEAVKEILEKK